MNKEYIFVIIDKDDDKEIKTITTNIIWAYDIAQKCYSPRLEIWFNGDYVDGCGIDENTTLEAIIKLMAKYHKNDYNNYIKIYDFKEAPKEYQELSNNGGDEDWIAIIGIDFL